VLARIYKPTKTAMQSGKALTKAWLLEFEPASARHPDPLTGWISSSDMDGQVRLSFDTVEEAVAYANRHGLAFQVFKPKERATILKAYADNFSYTRKQPWSH
jgi:delta 1-pyrroline-5-carboxylate dehydrogenase